MSLIDEVRATLGLTSTVTDVALQVYIDAAKDNMLELGIRPELINASGDGGDSSVNPMVKFAVVAYCNAYYNLTSNNTPIWREAYRNAVVQLMNSDRATWLGHPDSASASSSDVFGQQTITFKGGV